MTKDLEEAKNVATNTRVNNESDTAETLIDIQSENAKLKLTINESVSKLDLATKHFKTQTDQLIMEADNARIAEAEIPQPF